MCNKRHAPMTKPGAFRQTKKRHSAAFPRPISIRASPVTPASLQREHNARVHDNTVVGINALFEGKKN